MEETDEKLEARTETHRFFIRNLRNEIARNKIEIADLAPRVGMSKSGLYKVLAGSVEPDTSLLERLGNIFNRSPASFFGEPVAQRMPTIHEALRVIETAVERIHQADKMTGAKRELLETLTTLDDFEAKEVLAFANDLKATRALKASKTADDAQPGHVAKNSRKS